MKNQKRLKKIKKKCNQLIFNYFRKYNKKRFEHKFCLPRNILKDTKKQTENILFSLTKNNKILKISKSSKISVKFISKKTLIRKLKIF